MHGASASFCDESAFAKHRQHRSVLWQDFGNQALKAALARDHDEVSQQSRSDSFSLIFVGDREGHLGSTRLRGDIPAAADDGVLAALVERGDERHMFGEINVDEEIDFLLAEAALGAKETAIKRLGADPIDSATKRMRKGIRIDRNR